MTTSVAFWVLYLIWVVFGIWSNWPVAGGNLRPVGGTLVLLILLALLGWKCFGSPIHN